MIETLSAQKNQSESRLTNAGKLLALLEDEGVRWKQIILEIEHEIENVVGDVFLSVAQMNYLGPFTGQYREQIVTEWMRMAQAQGIKISSKYSMRNTLGDPVEIRKWGIAGLPSDSVSVENGVITMKSQKWPMLIDP